MKPIFIDFEASSLSPDSWPIEVGIAWISERKVIVESRLIRPRINWPEDDWNLESEAVHNIPRADLDEAGSADDVAEWLLRAIGNRILVSDAPEFDQRWLDRLLCEPGPQIDDFDRLVFQEFSNGGDINSEEMRRVYEYRSKQVAKHRAGDDAANLCHAWRAGTGK